jgi:hypothetical protein
MIALEFSTMTEEEHEAMVEVGDFFWLEFSAMCQRYINQAPKHLRREYEMYLGEKTSIYGRRRAS